MLFVLIQATDALLQNQLEHFKSAVLPLNDEKNIVAAQTDLLYTVFGGRDGLTFEVVRSDVFGKSAGTKPIADRLGIFQSMRAPIASVIDATARLLVFEVVQVCESN